jgi:hypothetical protein
MKTHTSRFIPHVLVGAIVALALAVSFALVSATPLPGEDNYNSPEFILKHSWVKFAALASDPLRDELSRADEDARVRRFFELNVLIREHERVGGDPASSPEDAAQARALEAALRAERADLENTVERILEGRLTSVLKDSGLTRSYGSDVVWPPVSIEFEDPPAVLVKSPRTEIRKESQQLLRGDLPGARVDEIEADAEADGLTSALVVNIGGIAMYPAIIPPSSDYHFVLQDIAHEWLHHYLYFTPLGRRYYEGGDLTTLNETLANMAGRELGDLLFERYPLAGGDAGAGSASLGGDAVDFTAEMRGLRREVELLLAAGNVAEAERRMEEKREYLADNGHYIRRINQAYFAFHGSYADGAGSIDPIGPKLEELRRGSDSLEAFVERARALTSVAELDHALTQ